MSLLQSVQKATNITWHEGSVSQTDRESLTGQKGATVWFTGLSASGKSTIAVALEAAILSLHKLDDSRTPKRAFRLDGDNVRFGLNKDLGFSEKDRNENIRRVSEVAKLLALSSTLTLTAFISPYVADREFAREIHAKQGVPFVEVYVDAPLEVVEQRDPKGLYKKARAGEIKDFTGISAPYEAPPKPEIHIKTAETDVDGAVKMCIDYLTAQGLL